MACSPRIKVSFEIKVPFSAESMRNVPMDSSLPSSLTPRSRKPVHSPESCRLRSNQPIALQIPRYGNCACGMNDAAEDLFSHQLIVKTRQITIIVVFKD